MIKKNWKHLIISSVLILLPMLIGVILWNRLPDQLPSHWNAAGDVDSWSSKYFIVFGMPLILLAAQWLCVIVTGTDPKKENHAGKILHLVLWIIPVLSWFLFAITYMTAIGMQVPIEAVMPIFMGILFVVIGNYLPKCKQNYTIGIKIPWTLNSEENWNRTHRFAGRFWMVCGLAVILIGILGVLWLLPVVFALMIFAPLIYSYILHRRGI